MITSGMFTMSSFPLCRAGRLMLVALLIAAGVLPAHGGNGASSSWLRGSLATDLEEPGKGGDKGASSLPVSDPAYAAFEAGKYLTALKEAQKAAKRGEPQAYTLMGLIYEDGLGVAQDFQKAAQYYKKGAALGDDNARVGYGLLLAQGKGVPQNYREAARYLELAAKNGLKSAQYNLALLYARGVDGVEDPARAVLWLVKAAGQGHVRAQYDLGTLYALGRGVARNPKKAAQWMGRAAEAGDPDAMLDYAIMLFKGRGVRKNKALAVEYLRRSAIKGNLVAQNRLAGLYRTGIVEKETLILERNLVEAAKWHLIARARGLSDARLDLFMGSLRKDERAAAEKAAQKWRRDNL